VVALAHLAAGDRRQEGCHQHDHQDVGAVVSRRVTESARRVLERSLRGVYLGGATDSTLDPLEYKGGPIRPACGPDASLSGSLDAA
jgi:hypothetical protein